MRVKWCKILWRAGKVGAHEGWQCAATRLPPPPLTQQRQRPRPQVLNLPGHWVDGLSLQGIGLGGGRLRCLAPALSPAASSSSCPLLVSSSLRIPKALLHALQGGENGAQQLEGLCVVASLHALPCSSHSAGSLLHWVAALCPAARPWHGARALCCSDDSLQELAQAVVSGQALEGVHSLAQHQAPHSGQAAHSQLADQLWVGVCIQAGVH